MAIYTFVVAQDRIAAERIAAERMAMGSLATDPLVRLQMAGINPEVVVSVGTTIVETICL